MLPLVALDLFVGGAKEVPKGPIDELNPPLDIGNPHDARAAIRHDTETLFTFA